MFHGSAGFPLVYRKNGTEERGVVYATRGGACQQIDGVNLWVMNNSEFPSGRGRLAVDKRLTKSPDTLLSLLSAFDRVDDGKSCYTVFFEPRGINIAGASLGAAAYCAMLGITVPENILITGFILNFGHELSEEQIAVQPISYWGEKMRFAKRTGALLVASPLCDGAVKDNNAVFVHNAKEMLDFVQGR